MCHTITQVPVYGHLVCGGCSIMLMYPIGAQSVKCSVCHHVTPAGAPPVIGPNAQPPAGAGGAGPSGAGARPAAPVQTVVVENPCSLDEQGNEVPNIAVGVKQQQ